MKIFALDTSSKVATIGILEDGKVLLENTLNDKKTHSENLMPMIEGAFRSVDLRPEDMDVFGVTLGPGAFTGLRIGISTIKGMAEAFGKPVVGLSALEVLAGGIPPTDRIICPILDAQRNQVYAGLYEYTTDEVKTDSTNLEKLENQNPQENQNHQGAQNPQGTPGTEGATLRVIRETEVLKITDLIEILVGLQRKVLFVGDGVSLYENTLSKALGNFYETPIFGHRIPRASVVGALTETIHRRGKSYGADKLKPVYLRKSQAEVQFDEREELLRKKAAME